MHRRFSYIAILIAITSQLYASTADIHASLVNRVDTAKKVVGMVVGVITPSEREVIPYGKLAKDRPDEVDGDTIFELGSTTKLFTSLLLADMIERGEVKPDTPVASLLPARVKVPERNGKKITLMDLSMHLSGLPRMPTNMTPKDLRNIYADYTPAKLYEFLAGYKLTRDIGEQYEYSNLGAGLLGHALALKAGLSYEQLVRKRILEPLGMNDTGITLTPEQAKRMTSVYDPALEPVKPWEFDALAGCGALRSTMKDMLKFMAAVLEINETPLKAALARMQVQRHDSGNKNLGIMMAWHIAQKFDTEVVLHDGSTAGSWSFVGFDPATKLGVVVLSNTYLDVDDVGLHAIVEKWPYQTFSPAEEHPDVKVDPKILATYVGEYRIDPTFSLKVTLEDGHLFAQTTTQPRFELYPESYADFYLKVVNAKIGFDKDANGNVTGLVLDQNGRRIRGVKVK